jgi:hypothetical protein
MLIPLCMYQIAKVYRWRREWLYPLIGILCVPVLYRIGVVRANATVAHEMTQAVSKLDSVLGAKLQNAVNDKAAAMDVMKQALFEAMQRAPDAAVIEFSDAWYKLLKPDSENYLPRCVRLARNLGLSDATYDENLRFLWDATGFIEAGAGRPVTRTVDGSKALALLEPIARKVDPPEVLGDPKKLQELPDSQRCQIYLNKRNAIRALPTRDAASVLGYVTLIRLGVVSVWDAQPTRANGQPSSESSPGAN